MKSDIILKVSELTKKYPSVGSGFAGVKNISFELKKGTVTCLVGPSGAGKSTLLRLLAGLEKPGTGKINFLGDRDKDIVFVSQDYNLWPHKTVIENIILAPILTRNTKEKDAIKLGVGLLKKFGLLDKKDKYPAQLSGGQKQRVALIRALAVRPKLLLLDEITSALDPELVKSILDTIRVFSKEGQSMIIVTHHMHFATEVGDYIFFLEDGQAIQKTSSRDFIYAQKNKRINDFIKKLSTNEQEINIYEGEEQYQSYHIGLMKRLPKGSVIYVAGAVGDSWYKPMGDYYKQYEELRLNKKIVWKMLLYETSKIDIRLHNEFPKLNDFRILPTAVENPANYNIMDDTVILQTFGKMPSIIEIKNKAIAQSYMNYFNDLWKLSKPL
jgi:ABC-type polar amino acid transport system ATPase subunit